jgi:hypothetical protein
VLDRIARLQDQSALPGTGAVTGNLAAMLTVVFESVAVAMVGLVTSRHALLGRLRATTPTGIPS